MMVEKEEWNFRPPGPEPVCPDRSPVRRGVMQLLQPHSISTSRKIDFERTIDRTKKPRTCAQGFVQFAKQILSADRYTGLQIRWTNNRQRRLGHDQFDPEGIPTPEIRRRVRLAQCVHAGLFRSGGCFGETRQLKYDP